MTIWKMFEFLKWKKTVNFKLYSRYQLSLSQFVDTTRIYAADVLVCKSAREQKDHLMLLSA